MQPIRASGSIPGAAGVSGAAWRDLGASWDSLRAILGPLGTVLGPLGAILGSLGVILGLLVAILGIPVTILGPLLAFLGSLGVVSWGYCRALCLLTDFCIDFGAIWRPKWVPKGAQNGAQNALKSNTNIMIRYEGFQVPLGSVLGPSWVILGPILGSTIIKFNWFYKGFVNIVFSKKISLRSASWTDLGSILMPKGVPKGSQRGSKTD